MTTSNVRSPVTASSVPTNMDRKSSSELLPVLYQQLRKLAAQRLKRERPGHTLTPTALVHEAYLRLRGKRVLFPDPVRQGDRQEATGEAPQSRRRWEDSGAFLAAASEAMRNILVDAARRKLAQKRGGRRQREPLAEDHRTTAERPIDLIALDEALGELEALVPEKALLVKLLYFSGLTIPEAAEALQVSRATTERWWAYSRAWLFDRMHGSNGTDDRPFRAK